MLYEIAELTGCGLGSMIVIGDATRDLQAARAVGSRPILVRTGKGRATEAALPQDEVVETYDDLAAAADALISETGNRK
jgi:D-glycero-D-manno-heptose 1,7-bisphosphate phosphatase